MNLIYRANTFTTEKSHTVLSLIDQDAQTEKQQRKKLTIRSFTAHLSSVAKASMNKENRRYLHSRGSPVAAAEQKARRLQFV